MSLTQGRTREGGRKKERKVNLGDNWQIWQTMLANGEIFILIIITSIKPVSGIDRNIMDPNWESRCRNVCFVISTACAMDVCTKVR